MSATERHLPEYDAAWQEVTGRAITGFVASHDLLGKIRHHPTQHRGPIRNVRGTQPLDTPLQRSESAAWIQKDDLREGHIDAHTTFVSELATAHLSTMAKMFFRTMDSITEATGNTHDAKGQPPSWDLILDMLEQMPMSFDEEGKAQPPTFVAHPETVAKLPPPTEAQTARQAEILERKEAEHAATKRTRRLPR